MGVILAYSICGDGMYVAAHDTDAGDKIDSREYTRALGANYKASLAFLVEEAGKLCGNERIDGIGVAITGNVTHDGIIDSSDDLPDWVDHDLETDLRRKLGAPVVVKSDICSALIVVRQDV